MAKAMATCKCATCGCEFTKMTVKKNRSEADSWEKWAESYYDECDECHQKRINAEREEESRKAAEAAREINLPELTGSEKQIAWAERIRMEFIQSADKEIQATAERPQSSRMSVSELESFKEWILRKTDSSWWIDKREAMWNMREVIFLQYPYWKADVEASVYAEPEEKTVVEPENKTSSVVCEVSATDREVAVKSAKDQGVIDLVKTCGYRWNGSYWYKEITVTTGSAEDRLIEIGNKLLCSGYPVKADSKYHDRIISGDYEPESKRWVIKQDGQIRILTGKDDSLEREARKISGASKYGRITVPASAWEEIMDFARIHDFRVSPGAQKAMDEYKASVVTVSPTKGAEAKYHEEDVKSVLDSSRDVLEDLKEDE